MTISLNQAKTKRKNNNNKRHKLQMGRRAQLAKVVNATDEDEIIQKGLRREDKIAHALRCKKLKRYS